MPFLSRFYVKLSLAVLALLLVLAFLQATISLRIFRQRQTEVDQRVNRDLAPDMAGEVEPYLRTQVAEGDPLGGNRKAVGEVIHYMMVLNPSIEIYILDGEGEILAFFAEPGRELRQQRVDLEPVRDFLRERRPLPILGDDPRRPGVRKHFSAAPIDLGGGRRGYLYIVLESSRYAEARAELEYSYLARALGRSALLALPLVVLLALALFFILTRRLQALASTVRAFGRGDFSPRAAVRSADEVGELAGSFNEMADTIEENHRRLRQADRQRRELTAGISHDLRTPLSSIRGYTETLLEKQEELSAEERRGYLEIILGRTEAMSRLVKDLLELSTLEAREEAPEGEQFSLSELVHDTAMQMQPEARKRGLRLTAREPESLFLIRGDVGMIERALSNLLNNALAHTPDGGRVDLRLSARDGAVRVEVADTGYGIEKRKLARIFDRFATGEREHAGEADPGGTGGGSGLGLAIARRIVELHGGRIDAVSSPGEGSTFYFDLPTG
jgi:signal transduction histidine kinase